MIIFVNKVFNLFFSKWKSNGTKIISFRSKTWVNLWQTLQNLVNGHFKNVIIQKIIQTRFVNNYRAYVRIKTKMVKMQHNSLNTLTEDWFHSSLWKIKQAWLKKTKINSSVTVVRKYLISFVIKNFRLDNPDIHEILFQCYHMKWIPGGPQKETLD